MYIITNGYQFIFNRMIMKSLGVAWIWMLCMAPSATVTAEEVTAYFDVMRRTAQVDHVREQQLLAMPSGELMRQLVPYYADTLVSIRQKAFHLTYRKGVQGGTSVERTVAVKNLLTGCDDADGGVTGQILRYLQEFSVTDFDDECRSVINGKLSRSGMPHYRELVLLAGYVGTGKDELNRLLFNAGLPERHRWYVSLALSRMGDALRTTYCVNRVRKLPVDSDVTAYVLPDLVYTRQKEAIDYCVALLLDDTLLCDSQNPDVSEKISCAYLIIPLLAPVIADFPVAVDVSGDIAGDYRQALPKAREWLREKKEYKIVDTTF
ncbi:MAG: hypothetical protein LBS03_07795 [Bacteroidales bacterium]|jgi:hypothetical protein|nr:hypothetical protein [Bacteroidales bacterium]